MHFRSRKNFHIILTIFFNILFVSALFASNEGIAEVHDTKVEEEFDVTEVIMHHIKDAHSWNLWSTTDTEGQTHEVSIPLPVILYYDGHIDFFMSSEFHHGEAKVTKGNRTYEMHHDIIYVAQEAGNSHGDAALKPLDFSITRNVAAIMISALLLILIFVNTASWYKKHPNKAPKRLAAFMEPLIMFVKDEIVVPNIGRKDANRFMSYLLTVFFFILINNLLGLVPIFPGASNVTGNIAVTMTLALFTMIITNVSGSKDYWRHTFAMPGVPVFVLPILIVVEIIGIFTKPFALMVRLFANITAGHIIILSLMSIIFIFKSVYIAPLSIFFGLFMNTLEILVAFLQAYIFTMLSALFIGMAVEKHH